MSIANALRDVLLLALLVHFVVVACDFRGSGLRRSEYAYAREEVAMQLHLAAILFAITLAASLLLAAHNAKGRVAIEKARHEPQREVSQ